MITYIDLGKAHLGAAWLDPVMDVAGAVLVANRTRGLLGGTSRSRRTITTPSSRPGSA